MPLDPATLDAMLAADLSAEQIAAIVKAQLIADREALERDGPTVAYIRPAVRAEVIARDGYACSYCGCSVAVPHLDHVFPRSRGGLSTADNLVVSCKPCNSSKKDRTPQEWAR